MVRDALGVQLSALGGLVSHLLDFNMPFLEAAYPKADKLGIEGLSLGWLLHLLGMGY